MISLEKIEKSTNIVILTDNDSFCSASALYTFILRLQKKVALISELGSLDATLSSVPWFDKVKQTPSKSADVIIDMKNERESIYKFFQENELLLNKKIATALYADYLKRHKFFNFNDTYYEHMKLFIESGADYRACNQAILGSNTLALIRLKSLLYQTLLLVDNARVAVLYLSETDLTVSGASFKEIEIIMYEVLSIVHVKVCILLDRDHENRLIKYKEIEFE